MFLTDVELNQFKNYTEKSLSFSKRINLIYGDNGVGKTNLLDAFHMLAFGKSHFHLSDDALIQEGKDYYRIAGKYVDKEGKKLRVGIKHQRGGRKSYDYNGKPLGAIKDLLGRIPLVMVAPDDITLVYGGSSERRDFINRILCQCDREYLQALLAYNRILRQKDALLKADRRPATMEVETYNQQLLAPARLILGTRMQHIESMSQRVQLIYNQLSPEREKISLSYQSQLLDCDMERAFGDMMSHEIGARRPLIGIHRDDIQLLIGGKIFKKYGSQGQVKSLVYSMRMSEYQYIAQALEAAPILVLDDYFEKLDSHRLSALLKIMSDTSFGQIFLTDTELSRSQILLDAHKIDFDSFPIAYSSV